MGTMVDLLDDARRAGLPLEVTPDFATNGHNGVKIQSPKAGYLHHTDATKLVSVYQAPPGSAGWDTAEWRPDVPSPRAQVYAARARVGGCRAGCPHKGRAHLVFVTAGVAYQAGMASGVRVGLATRGLIDATVPDAAAAGLDDTVNANDETMGVEIDWAEGEDWPADLLDLVCRLMAVAVKTFGWPGVGCWIRHRQATRRKVDPQTDFDFWARARAIVAGTPEDDMPTIDELNAAAAAGQLDPFFRRQTTLLRDTAGLATSAQVSTAVQQLASRIVDARTGVLAAIAALPTDGLSDADRAALVQQIVAGVDALDGDDAEAVADALAKRPLTFGPAAGGSA